MANTHSIDLELGSSQYLSISDGSQTGLDITGNLTVEAWIKLESSMNGTVASKYDSTGNNQRSWIFEVNGSSNSLGFVGSSNGSSVNITESVSWTPSLATWYHVAVSYSTGGDVKFYVNGIQQGATQTTATLSLFHSAAPFQIGVVNEPPTGFFDGLIDDVRVWSDVRTVTEIADNKDTEDPAGDNLQGNWKLNNDLTDSSGNGNTLTNNNSAVFSTDVPFSGASTFVPTMTII